MDDALTQVKPLLDQWQNVDELSQIILKVHLVLEERLTRIIGKFVFHAELVQSAKLRFIQKIEIARSISLDEHGNRMWELFNSINELRNQLAHSLDPERRDLKTQNLRSLYYDICKADPGIGEEKKHDDKVIVSFAITQCFGFLETFEREVDRFKGIVNELDKVFNPHRYKQP
jgi:hypothetical protein